MSELMNFADVIGRNVIIVDGAMGTMLQAAGMPPGECPEAYNLVDPEMISDIHLQYMAAGVHGLTSNTFGGSRPKLAEHGLANKLVEINRAGVRLAKELQPAYVFGDVGPTGLVLEPLGDAKFDDLFEIYAEQVGALALEDPDAIMIATMPDIAEARCALLAAKSVCDIPVIVSCTFGINGRMDLSGTDPATAAVILESCGADVIGMNCGLGPEQMLPLVQQMAEATTLPLIVQPNAGLPQVRPNGDTFYPGTPDEMVQWSDAFYQAGAAMLGSCCGSNPAFTAALYADFSNLDVITHGPNEALTIVASPRERLQIGGGEPIRIVGERINPTGKKDLADSLREGSLSIVRTLASEQESAGADMLDVNVGAAGVDAITVLPAAVGALSGATSTPLVIDTIDYTAMEAALKAYPGRALLNSVSGEGKSLAAVLPLARRYGAAVVVLALDDDGIPSTVEGRIAIVEKVRRAARHAGLADKDLVVDALVMTAAAEPDAPHVTLEAVKKIHEMGLATILGVSNVSHGLPRRSLLNAAFIGAAASAGLNVAIANPNDETVVEAVRLGNTSTKPFEEMVQVWDAAYDLAMKVASGAISDRGASADSQSKGSSAEGSNGEAPAGGSTSVELTLQEQLDGAIGRGDSDATPGLVDALIADGMKPGKVIGTVLTPAITTLGDAFGRGEVFLPQLMVAAEAMKAAVTRVKEHMPEDSDQADVGRVAFCTVAGDIHSIGKNICISMLESQGFLVDDLGVDVAPERVVEAAESADIVCLSALMTTTLPSMEDTIAQLAHTYPNKVVFVGGAVVTEPWAAAVGARYTKDAPTLVTAVREIIQKERNG